MNHTTNGRLIVPHERISDEVVHQAERDVVAAAAFHLPDLDRMDIHPGLFVGSACQGVLIALLSYHRKYPADSMASALRLTQYMVQTEGLSALIRDEDELATNPMMVTPSELQGMLEPGWHSTTAIESNMQVLRGAAFHRNSTTALAELTRHQDDPVKLIAALRETTDKLAADIAPRPVAESDPWTLPVDDDEPWPAPLGPDALIGPVGEFVQVIGPHTESDAAALLFHFLAYACAMFGRNRYFLVESAQHYPQLFMTFVGQSSKGRKGTAQRNVDRAFAEIDGELGTFLQNNVVSGLSSGEGLIFAVRDPVVQGDVISDEGVPDKRLLVIESEFANVLKTIRRETNTLSAVIRDAWDLGRLRTLTKNSPTRATGAHINIIGHTTREELRRLLTETDQANGFANRFLWPCTRRSQFLPDGGHVPKDGLIYVIDTVRHAVEFAHQPGRMSRTPRASELWHAVYPTLSADRPGILGSVTNRAEAQVLRLSLIYALMDCSDAIDVHHLRAALECWRYCEESARYAFGGGLGDPVAQELHGLLVAAKPHGMSRDAIRNAFQRHKSSLEIRRALGVLQRLGLAHCEVDRETGGRPAEVWHAGPGAISALSAGSATDRGDTALTAL